MKTHKLLTGFIIVVLVGILGFLTAYHYFGYDLLFSNDEEQTEEVSSVEEEAETKEETVEETVTNSNARIICIGDSQTVMNNGYPTKLEDEIDLKISTFGGKELTSRDIAARLNAYPLYIKGISIPEDTSAVSIELYNNNGSTSTLLQSDSSSIPTCTIDGIEGTIKYSNGSYTFTRSSAGEAKTIEGTAHVEFTKQDINEEDIVIFLMGNYDDEDEYFSENLITFYNNIIDEYDIKNYIIIGLTTRNDSDEANEALEKEFKDHFLDFKSYLLSDGLEGIDLSDEDNEAIEDGEVPPCFLSDDINGNSTFNTLLAKQLVEKTQTLEYID
ncbi:MAG: hypothetical protein LUG60_06300 [Erysipelotrichaceae bacterium]|nr:hypothetical protein [Erysipelotrichaceae bacterium]